MKIIPLKLKKMHFKIDIDNDGIQDWKDCRPFDARFQDIKRVKEGSWAFSILEFLKYNKDNTARFKEIAEYCNSYPNAGRGFGIALQNLVESKLVEKPERGVYRITPLGYSAYTSARRLFVWKMPKDTPKHGGIVSPYMFMAPSEMPKSIRPTKIVQKETQKHKILEFLRDEGPQRYSVITHVLSMSQMNASEIIRVLEHTGLIYRPERGLYKITDKGRNVLATVEMKGKWREAEDEI